MSLFLHMEIILLILFLLLPVPFSFFILFVYSKRRRTSNSNLKQKQEQKQKQKQQLLEELEQHRQPEEDSPATWLLDPPPPPQPPPPSREEEEEESPAVGGGEEKKRRKKGKKKRQEGEAIGGGGRPETDRAADGAAEGKERGGGGGGGGDCFPFSSFASATQRKIKVQYDGLVKSNQAKQLTMAQVGQFVNCLVEARNELQHKSEIIQRSFKIKKALLVKAERPSFDRLCQQIYKLEAEHKRLEEDTAVYNLLQEQLKRSPAYKMMLEAGANMELKGNKEQDLDVDFCGISFEELLAQEKKDSFWQKNGKLRSFAS